MSRATRAAVLGFALMVITGSAWASPAQVFAPGDLLFALNTGTLRWLDSSGAPIQDIALGISPAGGMRTHPLSGELWVTSFYPSPGIYLIRTNLVETVLSWMRRRAQ